MNSKEATRAINEYEARLKVVQRAVEYARCRANCNGSLAHADPLESASKCDCGWYELAKEISLAMWGEDSVLEEGKGISLPDLRIAAKKDE